MKLYKVTAKHVDWDDCYEIIVWADSEQQALEIAIRKTSNAKDVYDENDEYFSHEDWGVPINQCKDSNFYKDAIVEEIIEPNKNTNDEAMIVSKSSMNG